MSRYLYRRVSCSVWIDANRESWRELSYKIFLPDTREHKSSRWFLAAIILPFVRSRGDVKRQFLMPMKIVIPRLESVPGKSSRISRHIFVPFYSHSMVPVALCSLRRTSFTTWFRISYVSRIFALYPCLDALADLHIRSPSRSPDFFSSKSQLYLRYFYRKHH